jgi:hypothetical protein
LELCSGGRIKEDIVRFNRFLPVFLFSAAESLRSVARYCAIANLMAVGICAVARARYKRLKFNKYYSKKSVRIRTTYKTLRNGAQTAQTAQVVGIITFQLRRFCARLRRHNIKKPPFLGGGCGAVVAQLLFIKLFEPPCILPVKPYKFRKEYQ